MKYILPKLMVFAFAGMLMLASCEYEHPLIPADNTVYDSTDTISFTSEIIPIFESKCVACHSGSTAPDLRADKAHASLLDGNFVVAKDADNSVLYQVCKTGGTMANYISADELKLIKRWIMAGAKND